MRAYVTLGNLRSLTVVPGDGINPGTSKTLTFRNKFLLTTPDGKHFAIATMKRKVAGSSLPAAVRARHVKFHRSPPQGAMLGEVPDPVGPLKQVGLVKALVYTVPRSIHSPEKNPHRWHHAFGDTGHRGGDHYPSKVFPALLKDSKGNYFIKRRPGNIFTNADWIRG